MTLVRNIFGSAAIAASTAALAQAPAAQTAPFEAVSIQGGGEVIVRQGPVHSYRVTRGSPEALMITSERNRGLRIRCRPNACKGWTPRAEVTAPKVTAYSVRGGGTMRIERHAPVDSLALAVDGGGLIDSRASHATHVAASVHGGGTILTRARTNLAASVHGGGSIIYSGAPVNVASSTNGGGSITSADRRR